MCQYTLLTFHPSILPVDSLVTCHPHALRIDSLVMPARLLQGGWVTTSEIEVMLTDREDNVIYTCQGTNDALGQTEIDTVTLEVMCKSQGTWSASASYIAAASIMKRRRAVNLA